MYADLYYVTINVFVNKLYIIINDNNNMDVCVYYVMWQCQKWIWKNLEYHD